MKASIWHVYVRRNHNPASNGEPGYSVPSWRGGFDIV